VVGTPQFDRAVAEADLLCTAVGVGNVPALAAPLAKALAGRAGSRPVDVWVVENDDCAPGLAEGVRAVAAAMTLSLPPVAFAGGVATVAVAHGGWRDGPRPEFVGDGARTLHLDAGRLRTRPTALPGVEATRHYQARLREKLFVFNAGHAICGYLGWLRGHRTVADAVADPFLRPMVVGSLLESRRAVLAAHPELGAEVRGPVAGILARFGLPELADPVERVARDPLRKLRPRDRLLGPVALIRKSGGCVPLYFALGVAGALLYRGQGDPQARELKNMLEAEGVGEVLRVACGLALDDPFARAVVERYRGFIIGEGEVLFPPAQETVRDPLLPGSLQEAVG
jgi:mannitol-1-phosphate 5-dehydrogenase